jgi:iron complex transport system ATP-binding protein
VSVVDAVNVSVTLGARRVLDRVGIHLEPGVMLIAGRNGAGKTTLLEVLAGVRAPDSGEVWLDERRIERHPPRARARRVALIPQESDSPFEFTGRELVMMGRHAHVPRLREPAAADRAAVDDALRATDTLPFADRAVSTLSGGERRRIAIARALATRARILLADEPTANLDLEHALAALALLRRLADAGHTVAIASHDLNACAPWADRVVLLHEGRVWCDEEPQRALASDHVAAVFGVRSVAPRGFFPRAFEPLE